MKVINPENGFLVYQKIFSHLLANNSYLVVWQVESDSGKRKISNSKLNSFYMESKMLHLDLHEDLSVDSSLPVYCYSEDGQFIFKTRIQEVRDKNFSLEMPSEIKLLEESERIQIQGSTHLKIEPDILRVKRLSMGIEDVGEGYMRVKSMSQRSSRDQEFLNTEFGGVSLDEEEKLFAGQRETPRGRPKMDKWVKVQVNENSNIYRLKLFDLSQGGMGFITFDADMFLKGSSIQVVGIDAHDLDDPIVGKIMSLRPIDENQLEWKIGVKFEEGQS